MEISKELRYHIINCARFSFDAPPKICSECGAFRESKGSCTYKELKQTSKKFNLGFGFDTTLHINFSINQLSAEIFQWLVNVRNCTGNSRSIKLDLPGVQGIFPVALGGLSVGEINVVLLFDFIDPDKLENQFE